MFQRSSSFLAAFGAVLALCGCGGMPGNRSLESVRQPVVEQRTYAVDLATGPAGLAWGEQQRLAGWFDALGLRYGDRVAIDDPGSDPAVRQAVASLAEQRGVLIANAAPPTTGDVWPGTARVVVIRHHAFVPGCPDWSARSDANLANATSSNYGCAVNGNLAAMVADPADLVRGASDTGRTATMTTTKAIEAYRAAPPTGAKELQGTSSTAGAGGGGGGQ